ncbi:UvrD-helicase domain-containing protein [Pedobacter sp. MR2016-19]|uniref:UvrD-helicase domain-containing protein n=1 Tax=Pedobacter sp. MR2016-19 TaxID=2780089 RepID=UPI0018734EAA|nr:UvrD-helicase domain-containing protein [Pedobacter sp. MR2016-19]MBE5317813.1 UvrD-helicase domain-containing protein [Pedobacter sp. MR2016-19]
MKKVKTDLSNLNGQQKKAVVSETKRLLVLAGAGSGKTKTLLQKLIYLIEEKNVNPSNILAITFTKNAVNEMLDRLIISADDTENYREILSDKNKSAKEKDIERYFFSKKYKWIDNLTLRTFHSLCYNILRNFGVNEFDNKFKIIGETKNHQDEFTKYSATETSFEVMHKILIECCKSNNYLLDLKRYILDYLVDKIHQKNQARPNLYPEGKYYTSLNGTKVRSKSEQYISDWLYRHSIKFEYEPIINFSDFDFKPDFFIPEANLYIEHISDKSYSTKNKEDQFQKANKLLVKTYEKQTEDTALFNVTLERIVKNRLPANYHYTNALNFEEEFKFYHKEIKDFLRLALSALDLVKVENIATDLLLKKSQKDQHERVRDFYKLAIPLLKEYQKYCINKSYLDFNDMIIKTIDLFQNHKEIGDKFRQKFEYILVDEFQDVNNLQVALLKLLLTQNNQLFCVGDDWQSIYGFRGSNVDYIVNFESYFQHSKTIKLNMNYRSTEHIVSASNEVIKNNKFKVEKNIQSFKKSDNKINIFAGQDENENLDYVAAEVKKLILKGYLREDILFLYRRSKMFNPYLDRMKQEKLSVTGKTIHASKGLEAKAVFIIGLTEGNGGFPDIWMEDRIFQAIKISNHDLLFEEERRLFYVAITRAKDELFLITEKGNESSFLKEIPDNFTHKANSSFNPIIEHNTCKFCKNQIDKKFVFCPYCGEKQIEPN